MQSAQSRSPGGFEFSPRRPTFELESALAGDWHGGSAFRTAWFNALSMLFPLGERFFIESVVAFEDRVDDPRLQREISGFKAQESIHRRHHQRYNETLCRLRGYDLDAFETPLRKRMDWAYRELSARRRLAGTAANEHLTAILADDMLEHRDCFIGADPHVAALWEWHGVEETEHKSVAFDVHVAIGGDVRERRHALLLNTFFFFKDTFRIARDMLKIDGQLWRWSTWRDGFVFLLVRPGMLRRIVPAWFRFLRRDFHPWDDDNRHLIEAWQQESGSRDSPGPRGAL